MPELPEIETIRRDLEPVLKGHAVVRLEVRDRRLMSAAEEKRLNQAVLGQAWTGLDRKGKYLIAKLVNGWEIIFHLRMTGQLVLKAKEGMKYRMLLEFDHGVSLIFYDQRRFGEVWLKASGDAWPGKTALGPDPLIEITEMDFVTRVRQKTTRIKPLLMDQAFLAGVGNIYAQEALFKAAIRPTRHSNRISREEAGSLFSALRETLQSAIDRRGSTRRDYRDAYGKTGSAQNFHTVYDRGGEPCVKCGAVLRSSKVGGRGTVYCPRCQK